MASVEQQNAPGIPSLIAEIVTVLDVNGGVPPASIDDFWRQLAMSLNRSPEREAINNVRTAMEAIQEDWDDDFVEDDGKTPALAAYETVLARATERAQASARKGEQEEEEEGEDDSIGPLTSEFNTQVPPITTDVATLMGRIERGELVLNPEWQRAFVWKPQKMRRLIESMLLGLPIPSFLLYDDKKSGVTYVIDGRQRLETVFRFIAPKPEKGSKKPKLRFKTFPAGTDGWRKDEKLHAGAGKYYGDLPADLKSKIKGTPLVTCTFVDLPPDKLYQIFKRYNTGAVALNANEIRNAVYQASKLHVMLYRLAGEAGELAKYMDDGEREVSGALRDVMRGQKERYGAYGFIGRFFAFRYMSGGSVANATNQFMMTNAEATAPKIEAFRQEFIQVFNETLDWYEFPLTKPVPDGSFHAFLATVQMVGTATLLPKVASGTIQSEAAKQVVREYWPSFASAKLLEKQNSTLFWSTQREWISLMESKIGI